MQALAITTSKLTGSPDPSGWAQVHEFRPQEAEKLASRGQLFAVISTSRHEEGVDSVVAGRELLSRLHEEYFGELSKPAFVALKEAVEKVIQEFVSSWGEVEIAAAAYLNGIVYSVVGGGAQAVLFRGGMLAKILESTSASGVISASGYPKEADIFLLATKRFFETLPNGVIKAALEGADPGSAAESLAPYVHARQDSGGVGAVVLGFRQGVEPSFVPKIQEEGKPQEPVSAQVELPAQTPPPGRSFEIKIRAMGLINSVFTFVSGAIGKVLPEKRIYVKGEAVEFVPTQNRKVAISAGIVLLILLLISIAFGLKQKNQKSTKARYQDRLTQSQHDFEEAVNLSSINEERSRELFLSARNLLSEVEDEGFKDAEIEKLKASLAGGEGKILGEYRDEPALFVDLSILTSGFVGDDMAVSDERLYVLNRGGKRVVGVTLETKKSEILAGPDQISEAEAVAAYSGRVFILSGSGISEVGTKGVQVINKDWEDGALFHSYSGNLYLVDRGAATIWRYSAGENGFGSRQKWNTGPIEANFEDIKDMTIDGSIWLGFGSGEIYKFSLGNRLPFEITGLNPALTFLNGVYSNEELKYLYLLDRQGGRVVVLEKQGKYKAQYVNDKIRQATDLAVSEKNKKIILLAGDKLYSIEIKHL